MWADSCSDAKDGLCVTTSAATPASPGEQPYRCGPDSVNQIVVIPRAPADAATAHALLVVAVGSYERTDTRPRSDAEHRDYLKAKLALADESLEQYLAVSAPTGLDFDAANPTLQQASLERFNAWVQTKMTLGGRVTERYTELLALHDGVTSLTAASRMGTISLGFSTALVTAEIPTDVRTGEFADDKVQAFCDQMTDVAEPLEKSAVSAFSTCVAKAREMASGAEERAVLELADAAQPCLDELAELSPEQYPILEEVFATSVVTRAHLQLGMTDAVDTSADYDGENTRAVILRVAHDYAGADAAYARAIALDPSRPDAYYNRALLEVLESTKSDDLQSSADMYGRAAQSFAEASERAMGHLRLTVLTHLVDAQKARVQVLRFIENNPT